MTWHTDVVRRDGLDSLLTWIRSLGGTVACSTPSAGGVRVTWTVAGASGATAGRRSVGGH